TAQNYAEVVFDRTTPTGQSDPGLGSIVASKSSTDVLKNVGSCGRCTGGKGNKTGGSNPRGGAGDSARDSGRGSAGSTLEGDPVNVATGNKFQQDTDFRGSEWLTFRRFYNSNAAAVTAELGLQWRHSFDSSLE
ncbi:MAG: DUF6531 domain-containing protein, partial [Methylocella sp.]